MKENKPYVFHATHAVKRGDIYYADFGEVENAVGRELAKRRPVLIIQNNIGNKVSDTTICLCMSSRCKQTPYHVRFSDTNIINVPSDICAEQVKTIDKCRLEDYMGNVGERVMKEVDKALALSLGIKDIESCDFTTMSVVEPVQNELSDTYSFMQEQMMFYNSLKVRIATMRSDIEKLDVEIESVLNFIEDTTFNVAQGYKMYKVLREKRTKRKELLKEVVCLEALDEQIDTMQIVSALQSSLDNIDKKMNQINYIAPLKELSVAMYNGSVVKTKI